MSSLLSGADLNKYVIHAYYHPSFPEILTWYVVGKYVEAIVAPIKTYESSQFLTAEDLGLKDSVLANMRIWTQQWKFHNGCVDPHSSSHTQAYLEAKHQVEKLTNIIHPAVKNYFTALA